MEESNEEESGIKVWIEVTHILIETSYVIQMVSLGLEVMNTIIDEDINQLGISIMMIFTIQKRVGDTLNKPTQSNILD